MLDTRLMIKSSGLRYRGVQGLVKVYRAIGTEKGEFLRYETPEGVLCDERGIPLGEVKFKVRVL